MEFLSKRPAQRTILVSKSTTHSPPPFDSLDQLFLVNPNHRSNTARPFIRRDSLPSSSPFSPKSQYPLPSRGIHPRPGDLHHRRMFFSRPNELHPSGSGKTGRVIAKHVPVRSISISLIYFSEASRYTRSSVGVVGQPPPEDRSPRASASNNVLSLEAQQHWDTRARLGVPQQARRQREKGRRKERERERVYESS